ncbi:sensor histidine kinase [Roseofilum casamattae]|uniref:histidine kinase n=1 Tax=Roseofilum casamattae BLCC-M143 TaxID=3022442 RepID=A0ABT7C179_9CYAN|nr:HAMP domain-containing sensor histidine kinase [Roseofilum casamattae]MDJ1185191.1 HAMP domain-containing sensor histidine kinase [Roseofilum casamattae BLCC-M143]
MNSPPLTAFIAPAAVCVQTTLLQNALSQWSLTDQDVLVTIDEEQRPQGCILFSRWLSVLYGYDAEGAIASSLLKANPPLCELPPSFLMPICCVSGDLTLLDFPQHIHSLYPSDRYYYALTDREGKFLALLDTKRLLHYLIERDPSDRQISPSRTPPERQSALFCDLHSPLGQSAIQSPAVEISASRATPSEVPNSQMQTLLARATELFDRNQNKDRILAYIAHAFKTPITGILGLSNLLQNRQRFALDSKQYQYIQLIHQAGKKMRVSLDDVVAWSQLELGQIELQREPISPEDLCDRALSSFTDLTHHLPAISPLEVVQEANLCDAIADKVWLRYSIERLLLYNLLVTGALERPGQCQSLQFRVQSQGLFWISIEVVNLDLMTPANLTPWIPRSHSSAFADTSSTWELGLAVVSRLAKLQGGDLACVTHRDRGTHFTLLLPSQFLHRDADPVDRSFPTKLTVLYLSMGTAETGGDRDWLKQCHALQGKDCRFLEADDLEQAELLAKVWTPHVLVLNGGETQDIHLYLNGIKNSEVLSQLPLVTLSQSTTELANQIPRLSVYPCLVSPDSELAAFTLLQVIRIATSQHPFIN